MPRAAATLATATATDPRHRKIRQSLASSAKEEDRTVDIERKDFDERTVQVEARGGRQWYIVVDTPGGHCDTPTTLVPGIEREYDEESEEDEEDTATQPPAFTANSAAFMKVTQMLMANKRRAVVVQPSEPNTVEGSTSTSTATFAAKRKTRGSVMVSHDDNPDLNIPVFGPLPDAPAVIVEENTDPETRLVRSKRRESGMVMDAAAMALLQDDDSGDEESLLEGFGERKNRRRKQGGVRKFFRNRFGGRKKKGTNDVFIIEDDVGHGSMVFDTRSTKDLQDK
jgi:hypothetical protein